MNRVWVHKVTLKSEDSISIDAWLFPEYLTEEQVKEILIQSHNQGAVPDLARPIQFQARYLVNCSGAWAKRFAKTLGVESLSQAVRRQVSIFECKQVDLTPFGMFVDSSGVYFHAEANNILGGFAIPEEPAGYNFEYEGESFFEQYIWPALYERSTKFESLKHVTGWAGLYEVSPDRSGILGQVEGLKNVFEAHSFSGRGAMQSYGAGLGLAELMLFKEFKTLDLSAISGRRFKTDKLISEGMLI